MLRAPCGFLWSAILATLAALALLAAQPAAAEEQAGNGNAPPAARALAPARPVPPADCLPAFAQNRARWPERLPEPLETLRSLYLLGQCHMQRGELEEAERFFRLGLGAEPGLGPHLSFKLLQAAMEAGRTYEALYRMREVLREGHPPSLAEAVRKLLLARPESAEPSEADYHYLAEYLSLVEPVPEDHDLIARLNVLAAHFGDEALRHRTGLLLWMLPKDEQSAQRSAAELAALRKAGPPPDGEGYRLRARTLYRLRLFPMLIAELESPALPRLEGEPARRLGDVYFASLLRKRAYAKAATQIARPEVQRRFAFTRREALRQSIEINQRWRRLGIAQKHLRQLESLHPDDENLPGYYLGMARQFETVGRLKPMLTWCGRLLKKFPDAPEAALAYWLPIWSYYERRDYVQAAQWAERAMANTGSFGAETRARFTYWYGRILLAQGSAEPARATWEDLARLWPTSYYGLMARHTELDAPDPPRLQLTAATLPVVRKPPALKAIWEVEPLRTALFLFVIGEDEQAAALMGAELGKPLANGLLEELGEIFDYFDRFRLQYRITANYFYSDLKRRPVTDTPIWRYAYPRAFWENVVEHTNRTDVNPFFVLAVMREESNFHAEADSRSGAKGLMQLMPATAEMLARRNRLPYDEAALTQPDFNIALGTLYLKRVLKRYEWDPIMAAASYNAGPNAVKRWRRKYRGRAADEFVESIPYDETRAYVKRVISSYLIYKELYGRPPALPN